MSKFSKNIIFVAALTISALGLAQSQENTPKDAILILDASGSMWGQIDGINKIVIAKDVVEVLVRGLPEEQRLGMVAYGHRKKGDCSDIETIADVGADREYVIEQVRGLSPKGKTPLTKSVEHAALELNYTANAATVILVSDGLENCDADPCALARLLEENGLDFTVHVVGFDVNEEERKGLVCIAEETGGQFLAADSAYELTDALTQIAMVEPAAIPEEDEPVVIPQTVSLKATILRGGPDIQRDLNWTVTNKETGQIVFEKDQAGYIDFDVVPGDYTATAIWTGWPHTSDRYKGDKTGTRDFTIIASRPAVITVPIDLDIPFSFEADSEIAQGQPVSVTWSGPDDLGMTISTNELDDSPRDQIYFSPAQKARNGYQKKAVAEGQEIDSNADGQFDQDDKATALIGGPTVPGDYEVRYTLQSPLVILARKPLTVTDTNYTVTAPKTVSAATEFEVEWSGPFKNGDFVTIIEKDSKDIFSNGLTGRLTEGKPATLTAPAEPGEYEVRYILTNGYTLRGGMQQVVEATVPITVQGVSVTINSPATAVGGSTITLQIDTPGDSWKDDMVSVVTPDAIKTNTDARYGLGRIENAAGGFDIRVPALAGDYEIAYFLNPGAKVIARKPLKITRPEAMVDAPDSVKAGEDFQISYSGDAFKGDRVVICPADTPDNKMWSWTANYGFMAKEGEITGSVRGAKAVPKPGNYEARYVTGLQNIVLARDGFTVTE